MSYIRQKKSISIFSSLFNRKLKPRKIIVILSLKLNGIKLHSNNIDNISELISEDLDNVSEFLDTYWTEHYISVIVNGMAIYPCINNTEFNFDTSAEIIYYSNMIKKSYKSKFSTNFIFPNQLQG